MAAGSPAVPTGNPANPGSSLSNVFNFLKQFAMGQGPMAQAAGQAGQQGGGGQQPTPQPVQQPSLMPGQPNGILESIGRAILGKVQGSPGMQDTTQLKKQIDDHMKVLDEQKKAAQHVRKAVTAQPKSGAPQAQQDVSAPFHDLFHSVMSGLQS